MSNTISSSSPHSNNISQKNLKPASKDKSSLGSRACKEGNQKTGFFHKLLRLPVHFCINFIKKSKVAPLDQPADKYQPQVLSEQPIQSTPQPKYLLKEKVTDDDILFLTNLSSIDSILDNQEYQSSLKEKTKSLLIAKMNSAQLDCFKMLCQQSRFSQPPSYYIYLLEQRADSTSIQTGISHYLKSLAACASDFYDTPIANQTIQEDTSKKEQNYHLAFSHLSNLARQIDARRDPTLEHYKLHHFIIGESMEEEIDFNQSCNKILSNFKNGTCKYILQLVQKETSMQYYHDKMQKLSDIKPINEAGKINTQWQEEVDSLVHLISHIPRFDDRIPANIKEKILSSKEAYKNAHNETKVSAAKQLHTVLQTLKEQIKNNT